MRRLLLYIDLMANYVADRLRYFGYLLTMNSIYYSRKLRGEKYNLGGTVHFIYEGRLTDGEIYMFMANDSDMIYVIFAHNQRRPDLKRTALMCEKDFIDMVEYMRIDELRDL